MRVKLFIGDYLKNKGLSFEGKPEFLGLKVKNSNGDIIGKVAEDFMNFPHILYSEERNDIYIVATGDTFHEIEQDLQSKIEEIDECIEDLKYGAKLVNNFYKKLMNKGGE